METSKLCIMYGGKSGEHEVSLRSAASVIRNAPWDASNVILIGINRQGQWMLQKPELFTSVRNGQPLTIEQGSPVFAQSANGLSILQNGVMQKLAIDILFPVLHGTFGEDGTLQGMLEMCDVPYVGAGVLGSALGMDKEKVKLLWQQAGLPVVPFAVLHRHDTAEAASARLYQELSTEFGPVLFIKPARCGSSVGISKVHNAEGFAKGLSEAFRYDSKILVEPSVDAREVEVSIIGNERPESFIPGEILPNHDFYDYESKYLDPDGAILKIPAELDEAHMREVRLIAEKAYRVCEASGFSRVDLFLDKHNNKLYLNEINTLPGFTSISMFPMMCAQDGLAYPDLISRLCKLGIEAHTQREKLRFTLEIVP